LGSAERFRHRGAHALHGGWFVARSVEAAVSVGGGWEGGPVRISVFVESWQIECCWPPPAVGESRAWSLGLGVGQAGVDGVRVWDGIVEALAAADPGEPSAVFRLEEFDVLWWDRSGYAGPTRVSGRLFHDGHSHVGDVVAPSMGTVLGVRVEQREFVVRSDPVGGGSWTPTDEPAGYRPVQVSPKWFTGERETGVTFRRVETGVLVDVELTTGGRRRPAGAAPMPSDG